MSFLNQSNYLVKEAAEVLRTGENVVRNLLKAGRIRALKMPTLVIPDFELERFRHEILESQEDLSIYADKKFTEKFSNENKVIKM